MTEIMQKAIDRVDSRSEGQNSTVKRIAQYIIENLIKTDSAAEKILNEKLTLKDCFESVKKNAEKQAVNGCACVDDATVYKWVKEYYGVTAEDMKSSGDTADILKFDMFGDL